MIGFVQDIEGLAVKNNEFRRVLYTAEHCQLVVMALKPKEEIGDAGQCRHAFGQADIFSIHSDKRRRNGGIRAVSARARTFSKLFPMLRIGIAFDAFKYYVRREPGLVCMVPDDRLKILFRMLSLFKAFIDPNIGVGLHHSF